MHLQREHVPPLSSHFIGSFQQIRIELYLSDQGALYQTPTAQLESKFLSSDESTNSCMYPEKKLEQNGNLK